VPARPCPQFDRSETADWLCGHLQWVTRIDCCIQPRYSAGPSVVFAIPYLNAGQFLGFDSLSRDVKHRRFG